LVKELAADEAIAGADTLLLTVPNTLGVDYNAHLIESILKYVAPELSDGADRRQASNSSSFRGREQTFDSPRGIDLLGATVLMTCRPH
jgi:hypothetical protein